ncbi:hypothetical protein L2680_04680 [Shewanella gelidii]|nr:hypothetical protein [Shewanella gelidii]MCL1097265.1 hypothetical protein [Shewanella gelidii]
MSQNQTKPDFSKLNKSANQSFQSQKNLIKRLFSGKTVTCDVCQKNLSLQVPSPSTADKTYGVFCKKGCTDIQLEFEL